MRSMATKRKDEGDNSVVDPAQVAEVAEAQADVDAGRTVSYEKVRRWLLSWGTGKELARPRCK